MIDDILCVCIVRAVCLQREHPEYLHNCSYQQLSTGGIPSTKMISHPQSW